MNRRLEYIDQLKGLAIILVVMGHVTRHCALGLDNWIYQFIYTFHMPLFLFINGLVVKRLTSLTPVYLLRKCKQLLLPFFIWGIFASLYLDQTYIQYLFDYYKLGYWYLLVLFLFHVVHYIKETLNARLNKGNKLYIDLLIAACLYILIRKSIIVIPYNICTLFCYDHLVRYYPFFYLGTLIGRYDYSKLVSCNSSSLITVALPLTIVFTYMWQRQIAVTITTFLLPISIITLIYTISLCLEKGKVYIPYLSTIGRHTLCIYLFHFFLYKYVNLQEFHTLLYDQQSYIPLLFSIFLISLLMIGVCLVVDWCITQSKTLSLLLLGKSLKS